MSNAGSSEPICRADTSFHLLIHLGDIKSGSSACTDAYIGSIRDALNSYSGALVYTPGDNEWTDCHRNSGDPRNPVERLNFLRTQFFPDAGLTLGLAPRQVFTQAGDEDFPAFVENQAWVQSNDRPAASTSSRDLPCVLRRTTFSRMATNMSRNPIS